MKAINIRAKRVWLTLAMATMAMSLFAVDAGFNSAEADAHPGGLFCYWVGNQVTCYYQYFW